MIKNLWDKAIQFFKKDQVLTKEPWESDAVHSESEEKSLGNDLIGKKQEKFFVKILTGILTGVLGLVFFFSAKEETKTITADEPVKIETAEGALDTEKMWRNHLQRKITGVQTDMEIKLKQSQEETVANEKKVLDEMKLEMLKIKEQVAFAKEELQGASLELNRALNLQEEMNAKEPPLEISNTTSKHLGSNSDYDEPKDSKYFIPSGTFLNGYLIGGLAVSTALSTPDSNAVPVVIQLKVLGSENLPKNFSVDISTCQITGSSYGDLSSERAIVRLEEMNCLDPKTELWTTTSVAGTAYGDDGANGIKGEVVSVGSKHINAAMIGGVISGMSQSLKGQEAITVSPLGVTATGKQTGADMLKKGAFAGAANAGEKYADYFIKMAESVSPILQVPAGARVQVMFLKGFHIGELKTHAKIAKERSENKRKYIEPAPAQNQYDKNTLNEGSYSDQ